MIILGIETSCDETAVAVVELGKGTVPQVRILSNLIASQHEIHRPYGGIFPELASRRHIEVIQPLVTEALKTANMKPNKLEGVAVTYAPGLVGSLLVGLSFAKSYAYGLGIPFMGVNHLEGHLNAPLLEHKKITYPQIGLVVSGGHTALYLIRKFGDHGFLGGTRDDAAGEAFDKVAKILGLSYPGGPLIDHLSKEGNPKAVKFPKPKMGGYDFSFSGLKTAVRTLVTGRGGSFREPDIALAQAPLERVLLTHPAQHQGAADERDSVSFPQRSSPSGDKYLGDVRSPKGFPALADLAASFQETVVDILVEKTLAAAKAKRCKTIVVTGGVACNSRLRVKLTEAAKEARRNAYFASPIYCTDNAAMIAYVGGRYLQMGKFSPLSLNAIANLPLAS